jgi:nitrous oxidase accessory protein NosD
VRKTSIVLLLILILLSTTLTFSVNVEKGKVEYYTALGAILSVPGSYTTIQQAIDAATDGDTINVSPGTYNENVIVNKAVNLVGSGANTTIIDGQNIDITVRVSANNVSISGFTITKGNNESLHIAPTAFSCNIHDNTVSFGDEYGISLFGGNHQVHGNLVHDIGDNNGYGAIEIVQSSYSSVYNNTVYSNIGPTRGIGINNGSFNQVYNNTVYSSNSGTQIDWYSNNNSIFNNNFYNCSTGIGFFNSAHNNQVFGNQISLSGNAISLDDSYSNLFQNNAITNNSVGFIANNSTNNNIYSNTFSGGINAGISLNPYSNNNVIASNNVTGNNFGGISIGLNCSNITISENFISNNMRVGIVAGRITNSTIINNIITGEEESISIYDNSSDLLITKNIITFSNSTGIRFSGSGQRITVSENVVQYSRLAGISAWGIYDALLIKNNTVQNNNGNGMFFNNATGILIDQNLIENCNSSGIWVGQESSNISIKNNAINGTIYGIGLMDNASRVIVENNFITNCSPQGIILAQLVYDVIIKNNTCANSGYGIALFGNDSGQQNITGITIQNNVLLNNNNVGLFVDFARNITVDQNFAFGNDDGISVSQSNNVTVTSNLIDQNLGRAIGILSSSTNITVSSNNVTRNSLGVNFNNASGNFVYHNNFINNTNQAASANSTNTWDNGYPSGGNYWSNYNGIDRFTGLNQNLFGQDSIGDLVYSIDQTNIDNYPLVNNSTTPPLTSTFSTLPSVAQNQTITFDASVSTTVRGSFTYLWDFGDGSNSNVSNPVITHTYSQPGSYNVALTILDDSGGQINNSTNITVLANSAPTPAPSPTPTPTPTTTPRPTSTPSPTPKLTNTPTPIPTQGQTGTPTPATNSTTTQPTQEPTSTTEPSPTQETTTITSNKTTPLVKKLDLSLALINIPLNPLSSQSMATATTAAGTIGIASITTIAIAKISGMSISQIDALSLPKPLQSILKKFAEKKLEDLFKKKKTDPKKRSLITKNDLISLSTSIVAMSFVMGFVMANGLPNVLNPLTFLRFFVGALLSTFIIQTVSFFLEIYFSNKYNVQKELNLWSWGSLLYFISGLAFKFPFSSPSKTKTYGSYKYKVSQQRKVNALIAITKGVILLLPIIPFAVLTTSAINELNIVGSTGILAVLTTFCFALAPTSPSPGKDIFEHKKPLALLIILPIILLIGHYLGWMTFWGYVSIGITAAILMPIFIFKIEHEKKTIKQTDVHIWFK